MAKKTNTAARKALRTYTRAQGMSAALEPREQRAADLIADLLLTFNPEEAADILRRAEDYFGA
ncbi:hypothetical protein [Streptomyces sp. NPDC006631]|uniref:hypothetical protein n=1 Tax=Streptomyces sp. NPDC006631 TaxID=3364752 RepID=UPI0036CDB4CE